MPSAASNLKRFFRNIKHLCTLDLHRLLWRLTAMEKSIRGISAFVQSRDASIASEAFAPAAHAEINKHEFRFYSQNGEDGILLWIFSKIGTTSKRFVEFGMGTGRECICTNLALNFGWKGLFMDGSAENAADAKLFFKLMMPWEEYAGLEIRQEFITKENINGILAGRRHTEEPDLLVIDIDGNDYWVWKEIDAIRPRVVVIEYNATLGPEDSITIPYKEDFYAYAEHPLGIYHGVSVSALAKLGKEKGYVLVGCDSRGANAFFVQKGLADDLATPPTRAYYDNQHHAKRGTRESRRALIKDKPFAEV